MNEIAFVFHAYTDLWTWRKGVTEAIDILIDGRNLIDMAREVEEPFAAAEGHPDLAGNYVGLPASDIDAALETFLEARDDYTGRAGWNAVLICAGCGEPGCWPLTVRITFAEETVTWGDFEQPHRSAPEGPHMPWRYDKLGPFVFDRRQYERAVAMCSPKYRHTA